MHPAVQWVAMTYPCFGSHFGRKPHTMQGSSWVWAQPMGGGVTMLRILSLAEYIPRMIPEMLLVLQVDAIQRIISRLGGGHDDL